MPLSAEDFSDCWSCVASRVDFDARLPGWPFSPPIGHVTVGQYERALGADFVPVLETLAAFHGDHEILVVVAEPEPSYYVENYEFHPGFRVVSTGLAEGYWRALSYEPSGDPTGAIVYTANVVAMTGSTGKWAVWGQRDWDLVLVHAAPKTGPWLRRGVPFLSPIEALEEFTAPDRGDDPLTESELAAFMASFGGARR